jgi:hypothetical protein
MKAPSATDERRHREREQQRDEVERRRQEQLAGVAEHDAV